MTLRTVLGPPWVSACVWATWFCPGSATWLFEFYNKQKKKQIKINLFFEKKKYIPRKEKKEISIFKKVFKSIFSSFHRNVIKVMNSYKNPNQYLQLNWDNNFIINLN